MTSNLYICMYLCDIYTYTYWDDGCIWACPPLVISILFIHFYEYFYNQIILYRMHFLSCMYLAFRFNLGIMFFPFYFKVLPLKTILENNIESLGIERLNFNRYLNFPCNYSLCNILLFIYLISFQNYWKQFFIASLKWDCFILIL